MGIVIGMVCRQALRLEGVVNDNSYSFSNMSEGGVAFSWILIMWKWM